MSSQIKRYKRTRRKGEHLWLILIPPRFGPWGPAETFGFFVSHTAAQSSRISNVLTSELRDLKVLFFAFYEKRLLSWWKGFSIETRFQRDLDFVCQRILHISTIYQQFKHDSVAVAAISSCLCGALSIEDPPSISPQMPHVHECHYCN